MNQVEFITALAKLTPRRQEVLLKVLLGEDDAKIASQLYVSEATVRKHIQHICQSLLSPSHPEDSGYSRRTELISLVAKYRPELFGNSIVNQPADQSRIKVVLSYHQSTEPDLSLVTHLYTALQEHNYAVFLADNSLRMAKNGLQQIFKQLNQCDYLLLLLSPQAAFSEMVTEEVQIARTLQDSKNSRLPTIIPLVINCPFSLLNHDLRGYLQEVPRYEWRSTEDPTITVKTILQLLLCHQNEQQLESFVNHQLVSTPRAAIPKYPPQPVAEPELPRGQVELASAFYVERPGIDQRCYEELIKPGALIRIKAPRQMGKTSLLARIIDQATQLDYTAVSLSFQLADNKIFADLDQFLRWFCANISLQLGLPEKLADYWSPILGSKVACKSYFERYLLANITSPLVLGLDEVDVVFKYPELAADFFGLLRACHEDAKNRKIWQKLRLVVVHSTEVYVPMSINQSPFNVGLPIELPEFQPSMVLELTQRHGLMWGNSEVEQLMGLVGGYPYLVRLALYHITRAEISLEELLASAPTDAGLYGDHLRRHLWNLQQYPELMAAFKLVVDAPHPVQLDSMQGFKLHSMGLIQRQGALVIPRCDLYHKYFRVRLSSAHA